MCTGLHSMWLTDVQVMYIIIPVDAVPVDVVGARAALRVNAQAVNIGVEAIAATAPPPPLLDPLAVPKPYVISKQVM